MCAFGVSSRRKDPSNDDKRVMAGCSTASSPDSSWRRSVIHGRRPRHAVQVLDRGAGSNSPELDRVEIRIKQGRPSEASLHGPDGPHKPDPARKTPLSRPIDEAFQADGSPREHWSGLLEALLGERPGRARGRGGRRCRARGRAVRRGHAEERVPDRRGAARGRAGGVAAAEGGPGAARPGARRLSGGPVRRPADHRRGGRAGVAGRRSPAGARPARPPGLSRPHVAGFDVVRSADGEMLVLEDNLRTPSGATYALAARRICDFRLPLVPPAREEMAAELRELMLGMLRAAAPTASRTARSCCCRTGRGTAPGGSTGSWPGCWRSR